MTLAVVVDETTFRRLVRKVPAEINFSGNQLTIMDGIDLAVAERLAAARVRLVDDEGAVAVLHLVYVVEPGHRLAVGPAALEIGFAIERVIDWTGETIVFGDERLDGGAVLGDIGFQAAARRRVGWRSWWSPLQSPVAQAPEAAAQLFRKQSGDLKRCEMAATIKLVPIEQARIDRRRPTARRRQIVRKHADANGQLDDPRIVALAEEAGLLKVEAR